MKYKLITKTGVKKFHKRILKRSNFLFLEKRLTLRFIAGAKLHFGPKETPEILPYIMGKKEVGTFVNVYYLMSQLRKTLQLIYLNSYHFGMTVASALSLSDQTKTLVNNGIYYYFGNWCNGFLTNFSTLILRALLNKSFNKSNSNIRSISLEILETKRIPQLPTYSVACTLQHWHCNEAAAIQIPQSIAINAEFGLKQYSPKCVLPFSGAAVPSLVILNLIKDTVLSAQLDDKTFFLRDTDYMNFTLRRFTLLPRYEKKILLKNKKNLKKIMLQIPFVKKKIKKTKNFNSQLGTKSIANSFFFFVTKSYLNFFNTTNYSSFLKNLMRLYLNLLKKNLYKKVKKKHKKKKKLLNTTPIQLSEREIKLAKLMEILKEWRLKQTNIKK